MTSTNINIHITSDSRPEPVRKRVSIPQSDAATHGWWAAQEDPSTSVRLLILDEVRTNGSVDRVTRTGRQPANAPGAATPTGLTAEQAADLQEEISQLRATLGAIAPFLSMFTSAKLN